MNEATNEIIEQVRAERNRQETMWSHEHDMNHDPYAWLGLIAQYAARGQYVKAAALCVAAEEHSR